MDDDAFPSDLEALSPQDLRDLLHVEHQRCLQLEKDVFKTLAEKRKIEA